MFFAKEKGQGLVEYALILVLVAIVVIVVLAILGPSISNIFQNIINAKLTPRNHGWVFMMKQFYSFPYNF